MTANLPTPNLGGRDWGFTDPEGNEFVISSDGAVTVDTDDWTELSHEQWSQIAIIAAHLAEEH